MNGKNDPNACTCDPYYGRCGVCIMNEFDPPKKQRVPKKPNKQGICNCLSNDPNAGFRYTAHEMRDGKIVDVTYVKCDNCRLTLVDLKNVKPEKLNKLKIEEETPIKDLVWVRWCTKQCETKVV